MNRILPLFLITLALAWFTSAAFADEQLEFFEKKIRPVLISKCYECHSTGAAEVQGGLLLDSRETLRSGGESGELIVPGDPDESLLISALRHESFQMPPDEELPEQVVLDFTRWIRDGAIDPRDAPPSPTEAAELAWKAKLHERSAWWSLQPPRDSIPPQNDHPQWNREPVDQFLFAELSRHNLAPSPHRAEPTVLLRRLSFVLTGLPPKPDEVHQFIQAWEANPEQACIDLVDRLLASPHFGERFARHWMDVVRYTDTYGYEWDIDAKGSHEYRDYLIRAFNDDVSYDQLIREQIAGDLLPDPRIDEQQGINESLIGPMFYHLGEHRHGSSLDFNGIHQEMIDNKIDAFSKTFLAMTVACARCHDHKLDAISQKDYYALAGLFMTPRWTPRVIDTEDKYADEIEELKRLRDEIEERLRAKWKSHPPISGDGLASLVEDDYIKHLLGGSADTSQAGREGRLRESRKNAEIHRDNNRKNITGITDFSTPDFPDGWVVEGAGLKQGYVTNGTPLIALEGDQAISQVLQRGYHTHALSSKLPGKIHLPAIDASTNQHISLQLSGGGWGGHRTIPQNAFLTEGPQFFDPDQAPQWVTFSTGTLHNGVTRIQPEIATATLNANFPPRTGVARMGEFRLPDNDEDPHKRSWFSLTEVVAVSAGNPAMSAIESVPSKTDEATPETLDEALDQIASHLQDAVDRWISKTSDHADVSRINWLLRNNMLPNSVAKDPELAELVERYREVENQTDFPRTVNSLDERNITPIDYRMNIRGNVDDEGDAVPRGFLEVFADQQAIANSPQSGRLELARYLSSSENPQTARVYVNRVWQWIFGTGLVETSSDFGKLGDRPSHPELLDWLSLQFMKEGWSTKQLIRRLVLSEAFRQSGDPPEAALDVDPANRLLHHYGTRRLEAEAIRDSMLLISGRLDPALFGPAINPYRTAEDTQKRLFSGPLDGHGRRSIYLEMSIMEPPKFLVGFNLPDLKIPTGKRDVTNVPGQALILLNDPFVNAMAETWATSLQSDQAETVEERIHSMFLQAYGRVPTGDDLNRWSAAARSFSKNPGEIMTDTAAWTEIGHALFNTKEFLYYR